VYLKPKDMRETRGQFYGGPGRPPVSREQFDVRMRMGRIRRFGRDDD
jgi:hypothetical protein